MNLIKHLTFLSLVMIQAFSQTTHEASPYLKRAATSESDGMVRILANGPRPLAQTLDALEEKYGWVVNFEDPQFIFKSDLADSADPGSGKVPAGGRFSVDFAANIKEEEPILHRVVDAYNASDNPGRFELRKSSQGMFSIVGTQARDAQGKLSQQTVVFDVPVTLAIKKRTIAGTLKQIFQKISEQRHTSITIGVSPGNLLNYSSASIGGTKLSARDLISQTLASTHRTLYWRLLFDPNSKAYYLDIHSIQSR